jgi:hypothetical protein
MILKLDSHPIEVWFHNGVEGEEVDGFEPGTTEIKHRVGGDKAQQILFLPPNAQQILETVAQGEPAPTVLCAAQGRGSKKQWMFRLLGDAQEPRRQEAANFRQAFSAGDPAPAFDPRTLAYQPAPAVRAEHARQTTPPPAPTETELRRKVEADARQAKIDVTTPPMPARPEAREMALCFIDAINAISAAEQYAANIKANWNFESSDVRALAITMYIQTAKQAEAASRRSNGYNA